MPRANRHFLPGHIWHIIIYTAASSNRSSRSIAMLRSSRLKQINFEIIDRRYLHWVFEAKKRFGLSVLNYMITSNPVHLWIKDTGPNVRTSSPRECNSLPGRMVPSVVGQLRSYATRKLTYGYMLVTFLATL